MRNKYCLLGSGLILSANTMIATNPDGAKSVLPNVIIIYADDLGYETWSVMMRRMSQLQQ